jgi:hypothetical protein
MWLLPVFIFERDRKMVKILKRGVSGKSRQVILSLLTILTDASYNFTYFKILQIFIQQDFVFVPDPKEDD